MGMKQRKKYLFPYKTIIYTNTINDTRLYKRFKHIKSLEVRSSTALSGKISRKCMLKYLLSNSFSVPILFCRPFSNTNTGHNLALDGTSLSAK